ncbi:uncharacterized protein EV422DRAFT_96056 [Fimicolochytrium jonesii]|uniref:uncharacterized protein n=1 Tax=Fimicolochytrium jonesii TaxID=1396493 RepID=UPI0022FDD394|nr:uncharacterized protein EV422DRAFT_96056 [Fimicolochytrium jonesii]KAI8819534.1 hypothetical protein EV422DRAFT_96056 [Fimicolochytrium jonesii]
MDRSSRSASFLGDLQHGPMSLTPFEDRSRAIPDTQNGALLEQANGAMRNLVQLASAPTDYWKTIYSDKTGATVSLSPKQKNHIRVFKGETMIHGFSPEAIFALIRNRRLWDDWYLDGNTVEELNDNTSLTYMVMKPQTALSTVASTRDLALVDQRTLDPETGGIYYASTSVETPKIPPKKSYVRVGLKLNAWTLEPKMASHGSVSTRVVYYLQSDVGGLIPGGLVKKYLTKRAMVVAGIEQYLRKHGVPEMSASDADAFRKLARSYSVNSSMRPNSFGEPYASAQPGLEHARYIPQTDMSLQRNVHQAPFYNMPQERVGSRYSQHLGAGVGAYIASRTSLDGDFHDESDTETIAESTLNDEARAVEAPRSITPEIQEDDYSKTTNPHHAAAENALQRSMELEADDAGFVLHSINNGVRISQKTVPGKTMPIVRGDAQLEGAYTTQEVLSVLKSAAARKSWDARFEDGKPLALYNLEEILTYSQQKGTFPVSGRDFVTTNLIRFVGDTIYYVATSVVEPTAPTNSKLVRAELQNATWILRSTPNGVQVHYIVDVDIKGSVPSSIVKAVSVQTPLCILEVKKYLDANGPIPFIPRKVAGVDPGRHLQIRQESYDPKTRSYHLEYKKTDEHGSSVFVCLSQKAYKNGAKVTFSPKEGAIVERINPSGIKGISTAISVDASFLIRITVERSSDVDISFAVTQASSGGVGWTLNGCQMTFGETRIAQRSPAASHLQPAERRATAPAIPASMGASVARSAEIVDQPMQITPPESPKAQLSAPKITYVPHRHTQSGVNALKHLKTLLGDEAAWKFHSEQQGIKISTIDAGGTMPVVRGDATFPADITVDQILNTIRSSGARKIWDARFEGGRMVEWLNPNEALYHTMQKGQFPVSGRDLSALNVTVCDSRSSTTYVVATSVVDPLVKPEPKRVRAELKVAGFICNAIPQGGAQLSYIVDIDVKGSIPSAIVKAVSIQTPLSLHEIMKYIQTYGSPPSVKVLGNTGEGVKITLESEEFEPKTGAYTFAYAAAVDGDAAQSPTMAAGLVEIQVDPKTYPNGCDVSISQSVASKFLRIRSADRCIRFYCEVDNVRLAGNIKIDVQLSKKKSGTPGQHTLNGIPITADSTAPATGGSAAPAKRAQTITSATTAGVPMLVAPPRTVRKAPVQTATPPNERADEKAAKHATTESATLSPNITTNLPPSVMRSSPPVGTNTQPSGATTYVLAFISMVLRLLRPFLAPGAAPLASDVDPLDLRAQVAGADPLRLLGLVVVNIGITFFSIRWAVNGLLRICSPTQWGVLVTLSVAAYAYTKRA